MNHDRKAELVRQRNSVRLAFGASLSLVAGSLAIVAGTMAPAQAAAPVKINLVGINDFHGRIDANTVKWAGTVKKLQYDTGIPAVNSFIVGAGDLIGASVFASAVANDEPTIDVMNHVGLEASAVGNHEFDKGWADLRDRVIANKTNAHWDYLGANVYKKGTTTPVLPEYAAKTIDGVRVAVIGAVTQETPSLVSPGGITDLDFGDPIAAVNRVAAQLSDGNDANGEADVLVASFHAGSNVTTSYPEALAAGGEFAKMATLDPHIDAIFNGHTHQKYVFNQPVTGGDLPTRPMVQTGQYGENVGQIVLTYDKDTGKVTEATAGNTPRVTTSDADLIANPTYGADLQQVKNDVDAALANAKLVGDQPVGKISADITTAFKGGTYTSGGYAGGERDVREQESTLGDLVANALRDGIPADQGKADLGIVNPGGLRDELYFKGVPATNPANTDGVVTYAEANGVLPFVNNIWLVQLTGAELKSVLEQQWQPAGAQRAFLALGLSDNVRVTQDASKPAGQRITSVLVNGVNLDPKKTYTVSTFSFLGTGGDNFTAFKEGTAKDTGLVDRDLWIGYLKKAGTIAPDFARQQVTAKNMNASVKPNKKYTFRVGNLDLTSQGSPQNTEAGLYATTLVKGKAIQVKLGEFPVKDGLAKFNFRTPRIRFSQLSVVAEPSDTTVGIFHGTFNHQIKAKPRLATSKAPKPAIKGKTRTVVTIDVKVPGMDPKGWAAVKIGKKQYKGKLVDGQVTIKLPKFNKVGKQTLKVKYLGNDQFKRAFKFINLWVVK